MRIRHFAGYGCVNAKKIYDKSYKDGEYVACSKNIYHAPRIVKIEVAGEHECGLDRSDYLWDCYEWLLKRFCKDVKREDVLDVDYQEIYGEDKADYYFVVKGEHTW